MYVKAGTFLRHSVVVTTLQHQEPVDAAIYHLHLQKSDVLTELKIYRKTHEAKMHCFLLKCIIQTRNKRAWMCTAYAKNGFSALHKSKV